ncbi:MAG: lipoyl synthase [Oscillatoriales cyanobacterium]|uniref:Lipoyl synthase n=1 Tax=Microcoleus anatoxicus PTRS2 TaxID=2705321 RepID=A0ABU8YHB3_9CYAN|nr:MAG: lipoyl synthase [Oscillatoriales cyanobacterium]TAD98209.1 MAG: lipoyl synthase [Oscillatoriales cyanobacterium]TAE05674.1 MAG: lipoyl synthase [Oscillatoriales cyanobacterium]
MASQTPQTPAAKSITSPMRDEIQAMPKWLRRPLGKASELSEVQKIIKQRQIHTICEEGRCPNRAECYAQKTATFLLMGPTCTRACAFCQVDKGHSPMPLDPEEPQKVAEAVNLLGLRYAVLTSVARDDLPDGGAGWFAMTIAHIRLLNPDTQIEVLTPDFWGGATAPTLPETENSTLDELQRSRIRTVLEAKPACYNHNIETVRRLQGPVRRGAKYDRSLDVLRIVKEFDPSIPTKSGLMLGHGETETEIVTAMVDLRDAKCDRLTLGQYMRPSLEHLPVQKYWTPTEFDRFGEIATEMGFQQVRSGPLVRSSYHAGEND